MTREELQKAISAAAECGLPAVTSKAFTMTPSGWVAQKEALISYYSSGESVVCSILLCAFYEMYNCSYMSLPDRDSYKDHPSEFVWLGAWQLYKATNVLANDKAWSAIKMLLPGV